MQRTLLGDYERLSPKGQRWDADAREVLRLTAEGWNDRYRDLGTIDAAFLRAERAGCNDPIASYAVARLFWGTAGFRHDKVAERMRDSSFHPAHRCLALIRASIFLGGRGDGEDARQSALKLVSVAAADKDVPASILLEICEQLEESFRAVQKDRKFGFDKIEAELAKGRPESSILYTYRGTFLTRHAWDARGNDWANTVTGEGWRVMGQRLVAAEAALEKAWQLDSTNTDAARAMITVELGQGKGRDRMELWFRRAMTADPDNYDACKAKLYYLEPKWHGSPEAMLAFGQECLKTGNWKARIPLILSEAHEALAINHRPSPDAYFTTSPNIWKDIRAANEPYLKAYPKASYDRSRYTYFACRCEQWPAAHEQFGLLGDGGQISVFGSRNRYEQFRRDAAQWARLPPAR